MKVMRDYAAVTIGMLALVVAGAAVYGIFFVNTGIQAKPEVKIPDYTADLNSLKSQVNSINSQVNSINSQISSVNSQISSVSNNMPTLDSLKNDMTNIQRKITVLEDKSNQVPQVVTVPAPTKLAILLDKSNYFTTETIHITAIGANPQNVVQVELLDNSGFVLMHKQTWADSAGKVLYDLKLSSALPPGSYQVKLISDQKSDFQSVRIDASTQSTGTYALTVRTDKTIYVTGDLIQVSGISGPNTSVSGVLASPTGKTYTTVTTAASDGTYVMFFATSQSFETGNWYVTVNNLSQTVVVSINISQGSSSTYTLTAQTDKTIYKKGDLIQISGIAAPNTSVTAVLVSPSAKTYTTATTVSFDGTYVMFFATSQSFETGTWYITVNNLGHTKVLSIYIE